MSTPIGDYTHALSGRKNWPALSNLDHQSKVATTDANFAIAGRCVHLNSSGLFEAGATGFQMPLFLVRSATSFDVATTAHNSWGGAVLPAGDLGALVATGAYELETTEFEAVTIAPNTKLKAPDRTQTTSDVPSTGVLYTKKAWNGGNNGALTLYTDTICGVASFGSAIAGQTAPSAASYTGPYKVSVLAFWPVFIPGTA